MLTKNNYVVNNPTTFNYIQMYINKDYISHYMDGSTSDSYIARGRWRDFWKKSGKSSKSIC